MTTAMTSFGRPTTAVTYRRSMPSCDLEHRLEQRLAELAPGREIAAEDDAAPVVAGVDAIDEHLAALRDDDAAHRIGHDRVDQPVVLLVAAILERAEPVRQRSAHPLLDLARDQARLARLLEVVLHDADPAVERDVALELHLDHRVLGVDRRERELVPQVGRVRLAGRDLGEAALRPLVEADVDGGDVDVEDRLLQQHVHRRVRARARGRRPPSPAAAPAVPATAPAIKAAIAAAPAAARRALVRRMVAPWTLKFPGLHSLDHDQYRYSSASER